MKMSSEDLILRVRSSKLEFLGGREDIRDFSVKMALKAMRLGLPWWRSG